MRIVLIARAMHLAPIVLLAVLLGVGFDWRGVALVAALWLALPLRMAADRKWPPGLKPKWYRTTIDLVVSSIAYAVVGYIVYGGEGATIGFYMGLVSAIASIPLSVKNPKAGRLTNTGEPEPDRLPQTLQNSPGTVKVLTIAGFALPVVLLLACILLLIAPPR
jgi:hypothetical protein